MKRTQLYLDDELWTTLHVKSAETSTSISELVRQAVRERYSDPAARRRAAMLGIIGIRKDRKDMGDTETYIRELRRDTRFERLKD